MSEALWTPLEILAAWMAAMAFSAVFWRAVWEILT